MFKEMFRTDLATNLFPKALKGKHYRLLKGIFKNEQDIGKLKNEDQSA